MRASYDNLARDLNAALQRQGRPRKTPVTLADVRALPLASDRVRGSRAVLAANADTLGIYSGEYAARQRWTVGDATAERMQHARGAGVQISTEKELFEDGRETGLQRKRFIGKIEQFHNRGMIDRSCFVAGTRFQSHVLQAAVKGGIKIGSYTPRHIDSVPVPELLPAEKALHYGLQVSAAYSAVPAMFHPVLAWIGASAFDDVGLDTTARTYWPGTERSEAWRADRFRGLIEVTLMLLVEHYGDLECRWQSAGRAAQEIMAKFGIRQKKSVLRRKLPIDFSSDVVVS